MSFFTTKVEALRVGALARFAVATIGLTLAGQLFLGFEQSYAAPVVGLITAYLTDLLLETARAHFAGEAARYRGGWRKLVLFLLPAHIPGLVVPMLTYTNDRLAPVVFTVIVAIASKYALRVRHPEGGTVHFMNPSNLAIATTLTVFRAVGVAPPFMFTASISGYLDVLVPMALICTGTFLNTGFTKRMAVVVGWVVGYIAQALLRAVLFDARPEGILASMTGAVFVLFTFFMITDMATVPSKRLNQAAFGFSVAMIYMTFVALHVVFGLFYALAATCAVRGAYLAISARYAKTTSGQGTSAPDAPRQPETGKPYPPLSIAS